jgi:hypothetical protein
VLLVLFLLLAVLALLLCLYLLDPSGQLLIEPTTNFMLMTPGDGLAHRADHQAPRWMALKHSAQAQ